MKRRLLLMRHAKSSWKSPDLKDHSRPLNRRGQRDAPRMGEELVRLDWIPDAVLSSDAVRTRETWDLLQSALPALTPSFHDDLYLARPQDILSRIEALPPEVRSPLVLGHNPGMESLASWLTGKPIGMTTANIILLEYEGMDWADALHNAGTWALCAHLAPRDL